MNFLKRSALMMVFTFVGLSAVHADEVTTLPTIRIMAESELREEVVGPSPFQEDEKVRQALQHRIYKTHTDIQNAGISEITGGIEYEPQVPSGLSQVSPELQQYILAVASGFQSSDPTNGLFRILEPLNINRNNIDGIRDGTIKVNVDDILRLQQQIQHGLKDFRQP
jgi:hypothetical protein